MSTALDRLDTVQRDALERLQHAQASPERDLLAQLVETSCLLELAKIDATRFDPATYVQQCLDVVVELFPVAGAEARLTLAGWPELVLRAGAPVAWGHGGVPLWVDTVAVGALVVGQPRIELDAVGFADSAATQISSGLAACLEAETLRRSEAVANAMRLAADLDGDDPSATLEAIAEQLAAFAGTASAELIVDHPVVGAPLAARAGIHPPPPDLPVRTTTREIDGGLTVVTRTGPGVVDDSDEHLVHAVLDRLGASLARIEQTQRLEREVETDPLTGLGNRRRLDRSLAVALGRAERFGERVAVLIVDLDEFKHINDNLGHDVGDLVLRACARALQHATRGYDEIIRFGGDEIVILSPGSDTIAAQHVAERVRAEVPAAAATVLPPDVGLSVSIGIAAYPDSAIDAEGLLKAADDALRAAKRAGKDVAVVAPSVSLPGVGGPLGHDGPDGAATEGDRAEPASGRRRPFFRRR